MLKKFLARAHFLALIGRIFYHRRKKSMIFWRARTSMIEYFTYARQEMRARKKFFQHDILWWILYILGIFKILISFKSIAIDAFEYWIFSWKIQKKIEIFQNFPNCKIFGKNRIFKKKFKLQIALKNSLFELWPNKKNCNEILSWRLHF